MTERAADASNPIEAVRARLDGGRKWIKGQYADREGNRCLVGAITSALEDEEQRESFLLIENVAVEQYPDRVINPELCYVAAFNDHPDTTWPQVDGLLDKAARIYDEQVR